MKKLTLLILLCSIVSCQKKQNTVYLVKQWHLSPNENTTIDKVAKALPQYQNQIAIYDYVLKMAQEDKSTVMIAEGCERSIKEETEYNGWNVKKLSAQKEIKEILAPVQLKLLARPVKEMKVVCGDDNKLIKVNTLYFSDIKGLVGFYQRLLESQGVDEKKYQKYVFALKNIIQTTPETAIIDIKKEINKKIKDFESAINARNKVFVKNIIENIEGNPILVVGGLHVKGIEDILKKKNIKTQVITPKGYIYDEQVVLSQLKKMIRKSDSLNLVWNQVPFNFSIKNYDLSRKLKIQYPKKEIKDLEKLLKKLGLSNGIISSDYDQDGIRDFTISRNGRTIIISAEDDDWDNDGNYNLSDCLLKKLDLCPKILESKNITNIYSFNTDNGEKLEKIESVLKKLQIQILSEEGFQHDSLVLYVFTEVLKAMNIPKQSLKYFSSKKRTISYGKEVFFSYVAQSHSIEFYPEQFHKYISDKLAMYSNKDLKNAIKTIVVPILIQSLSHEIGHAFDPDIEAIRASGWSWKENPVRANYSKVGRLKRKKIEFYKSNVLFNNKAYENWLKENKNYTNEVNLLLKDKSNYIKKATNLKWFTATKSKENFAQLSFLKYNKVPSIYALSSPSEWFAEQIASCVFNKLVNLENMEERMRYEVLIGFHALEDSSVNCSKFLK